MLRLCDAWFLRNGIATNPLKCGIVGPSAWPPLLTFGQPIPETPSYKYLGVPFTPKGFDLPALLEGHLVKAEKLLRGMKLACGAWPQGARLALLKTFLRPPPEDGPPPREPLGKSRA